MQHLQVGSPHKHTKCIYDAHVSRDIHQGSKTPKIHPMYLSINYVNGKFESS